jgi:hypothetical protein
MFATMVVGNVEGRVSVVVVIVTAGLALVALLLGVGAIRALVAGSAAFELVSVGAAAVIGTPLGLAKRLTCAYVQVL